MNEWHPVTGLRDSGGRDETDIQSLPALATTDVLVSSLCFIYSQHLHLGALHPPEVLGPWRLMESKFFFSQFLIFEEKMGHLCLIEKSKYMNKDIVRGTMRVTVQTIYKYPSNFPSYKHPQPVLHPFSSIILSSRKPEKDHPPPGYHHALQIAPEYGF